MTAPREYHVTDSPNRAENGSFSCPHHGCAGRGFSSAEESQKHHENWHCGPYQCAECEQRFAAAPALDRHLRNSQHRKIWICFEVECELRGTEFPTRAAYANHVRSSTIHSENIDPTHAIEDTIFVEMESNPLKLDRSYDSKTTPYTCHEECCQKYGVDFKFRSELRRHFESSMHRHGVDIGKRIRCQIIPSNVLEAELNAIRSLKCNATACSAYQENFPTIKKYIHHLGTAEHRCGHIIDLGDITYLEYQGKSNVGENLCCSQSGCPHEGRIFTNERDAPLHLSSGVHLQAKNEARSQEANDVVSTPKEARTHLLSPLSFGAMATLYSPTSPSLERSSRMVVNMRSKKRQPRDQAPLTAAEKSRLTEIENENNDLLQRVKRLEDQVKQLSMALEK